MKTLFFGLKVGEVADLAQRLGSNYQNHAASINDEFLTNVMAELDKLSVRISGALKHNRTLTSLEALDAKRDRYIRAIWSFRKLHNRLTDDTQPDWAALKPLLEEMIPTIMAGNYSTKTAYTSTLLTELAKPEMAAHVDAFPDLVLAVKKLQEAQSAFKTKRDEYDALVLNGTTESATELKEQIINVINEKLLVYLDAMNKANPTTFGDFTKIVAKLIAESNERVYYRRYRKEKSSDTPAKE